MTAPAKEASGTFEGTGQSSEVFGNVVQVDLTFAGAGTTVLLKYRGIDNTTYTAKTFTEQPTEQPLVYEGNALNAVSWWLDCTAHSTNVTYAISARPRR